jgi:uncharacterized phiE125 gp8 family phage protein
VLITRELMPSLELVTAPTIYPIDLEEVRRQLRITSTSEDSLLDTYIGAAVDYFEEYTGRQIMAATWDYVFEAFPLAQTDRPYLNYVIELPKPPLLSVVSVTYDDGTSPQPTLTEAVDFTVSAPRGPYAGRGVILRVGSTEWPTTSGSIRIRFRAGYGEHPGDVPKVIQGILYFMVGHFHKFRAEVYEGAPGSSIEKLPLGADVMMKPFADHAKPVYPRMMTTWA